MASVDIEFLSLFARRRSGGPGAVVGLATALQTRTSEVTHAIDSYIITHERDIEEIDVVFAEATPRNGVFGVGLYASDSGPVPAIFTLLSLAPPSGVPLTRTAMASVLADDAERSALAIGLEVPSEHAGPGPGARLLCEGLDSTFGPRVTSADEHESLTTAGHGARPVGADVTDASGTVVGEVLSTSALGDHPEGERCADVAVVALRDPGAEERAPAIAGLSDAHELDPVFALTSGGRREGRILAAVPSFALRQNAGSWGFVYVVQPAISDPGDSGAPVFAVADPALLVGHVVAGASTYSLVQRASYVLEECGATLR